MLCPSCNKNASTFVRFCFTRQGVSYLKASQGYMKCMECGTVLKVAMFKRPFWIMYSMSGIALMLFAYSYKTYVPQLGFDTMAAIWIILVCILFCIFTFGMWKYSSVEKAEESQ